MNILETVLALFGFAVMVVCGVKRGQLVKGRLNSLPWVEAGVGLILAGAVFFFTLRAFRGEAVILAAIGISVLSALFSSIGAYYRYKRTVEADAISVDSARTAKLLNIQKVASCGQFLLIAPSVCLAAQLIFKVN